MNRSGLALAAFAVLLAGGVLVASGAYLPFVSGPGYQPTATDAPTGTAPAESETTRSGTTASGGGGTPSPTEGRYDRATVTVFDENGTELGTVEVAVADTRQKRYTGLSKTESLPADRGMLFTYDAQGSHTYVMRDMSFGIDIIYIDANGTIRTVHHAPAPAEGEDGEDQRYPGEGQYVLEVNYEWTTRHGIEPGDRIRIEGPDDG
ncbi:MAG: DUF192 domain-containing protein [Haloarculaceae archaeon]